VNGKSVGLTVDAKMLDLAPETPITVEGQQKRLGDLSADDQNQIRKAVADMRVQMEIAPETPLAVNGQPDAQKLASEAAATAQNRGTGSKQSSTVNTVRQKVTPLKAGNDQVKVFGDTLKPDTVIIINGVRGHFKDLSPDRQKQIQEAWSHDHLLPRP
jgi:hypothetical protein